MKGVKSYLIRAAVGLCFAAGFLARCANPAAPQGGPRDTLPPRVVAMDPMNFQTRFHSKRVYIEFDEYVKLNDLQKQFIVSPPLERKPSVVTKGRGIQIDIKSELDSATTYRLDFGDAILDNNEGNVLHGFAYVFSTGEHIDSLVMSGQVVDAFKGDSIYNALVLFFDARADSLEHDSVVFKSPVLSIARTDSAGIFIAENLKDMDYRLYALLDDNGNGRYEPGTERIGFQDTVFNPARLPDFQVWYDTAAHRLSATPQVRFRIFSETPVRRQNLSDSKRPKDRRVDLFFTSPYPEILDLVMEGIDTARVIRQANPTGDSLTFWLAQPDETLPDTIRGHVTFMSLDSVGRPASVTKKLSLAKPFTARHAKRNKKEEEKNPFKIKVDAALNLNPERGIPFSFEYPLLRADSAAIVLEKVVEVKIRGQERVRTKDEERRTRKIRVPVHMVPDTADVLKWKFDARWENGQAYELFIPPGTFTNIAGESNDTLKAAFTTFDPDKYGVVFVDVKGADSTRTYIVQLTDVQGNVLQTRAGARPGRYRFNFVPAGEYRIKLIEDMNGNGKWDGGNVVKRIPPERIAVVTESDGRSVISAKAGWEIEITADTQRLFPPGQTGGGREGPILIETLPEKSPAGREIKKQAL